MTAVPGRSIHMDFNNLQRVKVYRLNDEGKWDDKGTGHVSVEYLERSEAVGLVVIDEEDSQTLLVHRISADDIYRRQEDTIILWTDPEVATDLALSFQETMGCSFIWANEGTVLYSGDNFSTSRLDLCRDQIYSVQRSICFPPVSGLESSARPATDDLEHSGTSQDDTVVHSKGTALTFPVPFLGFLPEVTIAEVLPTDRDRVASLVVHEQNYIRKLIELFRNCEDLKNLEGLHMMFKIVKGVISLNDGHIFDIIFSDEYIMDIVGALEYDPELSSHQDHRKFLREQVVYKEVVPIHDSAVLSKIHQTYRIGYIKDVILPRVLDDQTSATINSIMLFNNVAVVSSLQSDNAFLSELFSKLRSPDTPEPSRRDLVSFIQEFCNLSKHLQASLRSQLFGALVKEGLFEIVTTILKSSEESVRLSGCDILMVVLNHDPALLRSFLVHQHQHALFSELVGGMLTHTEGGLQVQLLEIMRMLLDSDTMEPQVEKSTFLDVFYEKYMDQMVEMLIAGCPPKAGSTELPKDLPTCIGKEVVKGRDRSSPEILGNICELMCFCVQHHRFRIKYYVMRNNVVEKILRLTHRREKYLVVAAVRFLRTCVSLKDEFYFRFIVKHNLFEPVIQVFLANGNRYNLLNSAVLELIDFIQKEGIKSLILYLVENFSAKLESIDYVDTFRSLKLKYEQSLEVPPVSSREAGRAGSSRSPEHDVMQRMRYRLNHLGSNRDRRKRKDERTLDKEEEDYFNEDSDDEEDTATARLGTSSNSQSTPAVIVNGITLGDGPFRSSTFGLVDYDDEDEDIPAGGNRKDGTAVLERKSQGLRTTPTSDPFWPESEDHTVAKRKALAPSASRDDPNTAASKRLRPEGHLKHHSKNSNERANVMGGEDFGGVRSTVANAKGSELPELSTVLLQDTSAPPVSLQAPDADDDKENRAISRIENEEGRGCDSILSQVSNLAPSVIVGAPGGTSDFIRSVHLESASRELEMMSRAVLTTDVGDSLSHSSNTSPRAVPGGARHLEEVAKGEPRGHSDTVLSTVPSEHSTAHIDIPDSARDVFSNMNELAHSKGGHMGKAGSEKGVGSLLGDGLLGFRKFTEGRGWNAQPQEQ